MTNSITSDRDYLELFRVEDFTQSASGSTDADFNDLATVYWASNWGVTTITHNLGTVPMVRAYYDPDKNGRLYNTLKLTGTGFQTWANPWMLTLSTTTITKIAIMSDVSSTNIPVHCRLYRFASTVAVTSDELIDKIFKKDTSNATLAAAGSSVSPVTTTQTIPHGQSAEVLNTLEYSTDQSTWYSAGTFLFNGFDTSSGPPGGPYSYYFYSTALASADSTNLYIYYEHNNPSQTTIYVRYALDLRV